MLNPRVYGYHNDVCRLQIIKKKKIEQTEKFTSAGVRSSSSAILRRLEESSELKYSHKSPSITLWNTKCINFKLCTQQTVQIVK